MRQSNASNAIDKLTAFIVAVGSTGLVVIFIAWAAVKEKSIPQELAWVLTVTFLIVVGASIFYWLRLVYRFGLSPDNQRTEEVRKRG